MFEWDARKAKANALKHEIDFSDLMAIFEAPHLTV